MTDQFGRTITSQDNGDGTTTYTASDNTAVVEPTAMALAAVINIFNGMSPSVASLAPEKQLKLKQFNGAIQDFVSSKYDRDTQVRLLGMYLAAQSESFSNRVAYIAQLLSWIQSVATYSASFINAVMSASDPNAVAAMQWDFSQIAADPGITILGAITISN